MADEVVTVSEATDIVNVSDRTIRRWIESGDVKANRGMGPG
jgi:excisionase family DNA binding protein